MVIEKREDYKSEWATFTAISKLSRLVHAARVSDG